MIYVGCDISLNHGACVALDEGLMFRGAWAYTDKVGAGKAMAKTSAVGCEDVTVAVLPRPVRLPKDKALKSMRRLVWLRDAFADACLLMTDTHPHTEIIWCLEDYALGKAQGAHQIGEAGGLFRTALARWLRHGGRLRLHDPMTVKLSSGSGVADKQGVGKAVLRRVDGLHPELDEKFGTVGEDIYDAAQLAIAARDEDLVRRGLLRMDQLEAGMRRVFLRVTKSSPINLLDRDYIEL